METLKKLLPLPAISLLILAACANPLTQEPAPQAPTPTPTDQTQPAETPPIPTDTPETTQAPESRYGTNLKCSDLNNAENRQNCELQMNDLVGIMLESEIINSFDSKRCKELPEDIAADCEARLNESGIQGPISSTELALFREATQGTFPDPEELTEGLPVPTYDISKCSQLTAPGYKAHCEKQINNRLQLAKLDEIIQANDVNRCDELTDEDTVTQCKLFFGVEVEPDID
jgi:hypothetical protein